MSIRILAVASLIASVLTGCGNSASSVRCVREVDGGQCVIDLQCGTDSCPSGEKSVDQDPNSSLCADEHQGCL